MSDKGIGQKVLYFPLTKIVIGIIVVASLYGLSQYAMSQVLESTSISKENTNLTTGIFASIVALISYWLLYRYYEKRVISELSSTRIIKHLLVGFFLGALLQSLTILVIYLKGGFEITSINAFIYIIPALAMAFTTAIFEEILFRGIFFRIIEEKLGSYIALVISALIFGTLHFGNPNSSFILSLGLAIQAGLLLGVAYIYTRNLWLPIALHFAWNFSQSGIYGATVSGHKPGKSLLTSEITGAAWYTGGEFGPEGSIQATIFCLIAASIIMYFCIKGKKLIKPYWSNSQ